MTGWIAVLGPLLTVFGGLVVADLLTIRNRLRRRIDKRLSILDKMPDGFTKDELGRINRRDTLELIHRSRPLRTLPGKPRREETWGRAAIAFGCLCCSTRCS